MTRRIIWLGAAALLLAAPASAGNPPEVQWTRVFHGQGEAAGAWVAQTDDGGYVCTGWTTSADSTYPDIYLVKTDSAGTLLWDVSLGASEWDEGKGVVQTFDGGYALVGWDGSHLGLPLLVKVDSAGGELWRRNVYRDSCEWGQAVLQTPDGGFVLGCYKSGGDTTGLWLVKTDSQGYQVWDRIYATAYDDQPNVFSIGLANDGGFILAGAMEGLWLVRTDSLGGIVWSRSYSGQKTGHGYSAAQTADSGFVVTGAGGSASDYADPSVIYLLKTDAQGNVEWRREFGGDNMDCGYSVRQTTDGGYVVAGVVADSGNSNDAFVVKTNAAGVQQWSRTFGAAGTYDNVRCIEQTQDGGYILCGLMTNAADGRASLFMAKLAPNGM